MDVFKIPGAFSWSELVTPDPARAAEFYGQPGVGRMAVLQDPQGAVLSVIAYAAM